MSGLKSDSTKGGGGYNEYVMDDTKGNEPIREHGQYDKDSTIEHDLREHVLNSRFRDVHLQQSNGYGRCQQHADDWGEPYREHRLEHDHQRRLDAHRDGRHQLRRNGRGGWSSRWAP